MSLSHLILVIRTSDYSPSVGQEIPWDLGKAVHLTLVLLSTPCGSHERQIRFTTFKRLVTTLHSQGVRCRPSMESREEWPAEAVSKMDQLERKNRELLARVMMAQGVLDSNQITDTEIQSGFLQLRDAIFSYIQAIYRHLGDEQPGWSFKDALLDRLSRHPSAGKRHWMKWLAEHNNNTCILFVLSRAIWDCISSNIFRSDSYDNYQMWLPLGMSDSTHFIFEEIMKSIQAGADKECMPHCLICAKSHHLT